MLGVFRRNVPIRDLMRDFHDLHSHLLPTVDDGSSSVNQSEQLLDELSGLGVKAMYCTPHVIADIYPSNTNAYLRGRFNEFVNSLTNTCGIELRLGAEYLLDDVFLSHIDNDPLLMGESNMLVEFTMGSLTTSTFEMLFEVQLNGITPIIAHPERYHFLAEKGSNTLSRMIDSGCKMQLNLLSVCGWHGKRAQLAAHKMLDANLYNYVGSDTHSMSHIGAIKTLDIPRKYVERIEQLKLNNEQLFI